MDGDFEEEEEGTDPEFVMDSEEYMYASLLKKHRSIDLFITFFRSDLTVFLCLTRWPIICKNIIICKKFKYNSKNKN